MTHRQTVFDPGLTHTPIKPFLIYPEDWEKMLELCAKIENGYDHEVAHAAHQLADLVKAIIEDEKFGEERQGE